MDRTVTSGIESKTRIAEVKPPMPISKKMNAQLNQQITHEFEAGGSYLAMSCQFDQMGLKTLSAHFRKQAEEERGHALKILDYLQEVGGAVELTALAKPPAAYPSVHAAVKAALSSEKKVTGQIHDLVTLAEQQKDYATRSFLNWFVDEQVEEEAGMSAVLQLVEMAGKNLLQLESHLARMGHSE